MSTCLESIKTGLRVFFWSNPPECNSDIVAYVINRFACGWCHMTFTLCCQVKSIFLVQLGLCLAFFLHRWSFSFFARWLCHSPPLCWHFHNATVLLRQIRWLRSFHTVQAECAQHWVNTLHRHTQTWLLALPSQLLFLQVYSKCVIRTSDSVLSDFVLENKIK